LRNWRRRLKLPQRDGSDRFILDLSLLMNAPYERTIRFADVDGAGFVYFPNYLSMCHEAYEASLAAAGMELRTFFATHRTLIPVAKCQAQYLGPLQSGNRMRIEFTRTATGPDSFTLNYRVINLSAGDKLVAIAVTEHVAIDLQTLERKPLPAVFTRWLKGGGA